MADGDTMTDANDNRSPRGDSDVQRTEGQYVRADSLEARNESISSDGSLTAVPLDAVDDYGVNSEDAVTDANGWFLTRDFIRLSVEATADTGSNGNSCDFTVQGKFGENGETLEIIAATTVATTATGQIATAENIEAYGYVRVLENGTSGDTQEVRVLCK